jgi:phosphomethylpyrimidine synthase
MRWDRISSARRSLGVGGCSMKITEDVRKFAAEQKISEEQTLQVGLEQKANEFTKSGSEVYAKT